MKRFKTILSLLVLFCILITLQGNYSNDYDYYAIYMERKELEKSVSFMEQGKEMKNPGKIYYKHPYLFVNEKYKGIHVFDNTDPENPVNKGFIVAPGCIDMAVKDHVIYLDNAVDLVSFDLNRKILLNRIPNVFPELSPPNGYVRYDYNRDRKLILVEWAKY